MLYLGRDYDNKVRPFSSYFQGINTNFLDVLLKNIKNMSTNIADILKQKRREKKPRPWTQTQAAEAIGVSLRQYQKYEHNLMPPWDVLEKIQEVFGFSVTNLKDEQKRHRTITISQRHLLI